MGPLHYIYINKEPQNSIGNYLDPYITETLAKSVGGRARPLRPKVRRKLKGSEMDLGENRLLRG